MEIHEVFLITQEFLITTNCNILQVTPLVDIPDAIKSGTRKIQQKFKSKRKASIIEVHAKQA